MSTYSQIYIQIVFAVKGRAYLIDPSWEERLYKFITGIVTNKNQKLLAINGMPDHVHILIEMKRSCCLSDLVREIKKSSNIFIKEQQFTKFEFGWQEGFGAFPYSHTSLNNAISYIQNQKQHHEKHSLKDEYIRLLQTTKTDYKEDYLF